MIEMNYAMHDLDLLAIVDSLRVWRHYLIERNLKKK
jgi:hypothetical protein